MKFLTINQTAALDDCPVTAGRLRAMVKRGEVPGFYTGNTFRINTAALFSMLEQRSLEHMQSLTPAAFAHDHPEA